MSRPMDDAAAARYLLKYVIAGLGAEAAAAALQATSPKDGIAPFAHTVFTRQFIREAQAFQRSRQCHELFWPDGLEGPIELPALVANADDHGVPLAIVAGFAFGGGQYLLVIGAWCCPLNELRLHGLFSGCDVALLNYAARYLHKAGGDVSELCLQPHATARSSFCAPLRAAAH